MPLTVSPGLGAVTPMPGPCPHAVDTDLWLSGFGQRLTTTRGTVIVTLRAVVGEPTGAVVRQTDDEELWDEGCDV